MSGFEGVLAHQGGWDELLLVALPIAVFVVLLRVANQRAARLARPVVEETPPTPGPTPPDPDR